MIFYVWGIIIIFYVIFPETGDCKIIPKNFICTRFLKEIKYCLKNLFPMEIELVQLAQK